MKKKINFSRLTVFSILIIMICSILLTSCGSKYGKKNSKGNRLMLHSEYIEFISPINNKIIKIRCPYPIEFDSVF